MQRIFLPLCLFSLILGLGLTLLRKIWVDPSLKRFREQELATRQLDKELESHYPYQTIGKLPLRFKQPEALPSLKGGYALELGRFEVQEEAEAYVQKWHRFGLMAYFSPVRLQEKVLYPVRHGLFGSEKKAEEAQSRLTKRFGLRASVVELR